MLRYRKLGFRLLCGATFYAVASMAAAFSFSEETEKEARADDERAAASRTVLSLPAVCLDDLKRRKIMIVMGERTGEGITANQARYSPHFNSINKRLLKQGVRTWSQQEITAQIAQAEVDAYFRNDPDAALAASKKLGAQLILRGTITSRSMLNPVVRIPEVYVTVAFALMKPDGTLVSDAQASAESYSGSDTLGMASTLVEEKADGVVNALLGGYCANTASAGSKKHR